MAKALKVIGVVAGAVALVAATVATFGGASFAYAALAGTIAATASVVAAVASFGSYLLTKPPPARGSVTQLTIATDAPAPYPMGEGYFAGVLRHQADYGATLNKVPNPYRFWPVVYATGGPIEGPLTPQVDFAAVPAWYSGYLFTDTQLGECPEASALSPQWGGAPGWDASSKLSGQAAIGWSFLFDKDGKRFAGGIPTTGAYGKWVKVYDPRLDDTRPGGSGDHRVDDETTFEWSENPALHAAMYAYGRYQGDDHVRVMGVGLPDEGIDWEAVAAWANDCDANDWRLFGVVSEPGDRWQNLKDICEAGGGEPVFAGAVLSFHWSRPRIALDTVTEADLAEGDHEVTAMASWRDRLNTIVPKYLSPDHNWQLVAAEKVVVSSYLAEDGEERVEEWPFNFVKDADQAAQLARYKLENGRELQPITLVLKPRLRAYRPGECLHLDLPQLGLDTPAVMVRRSIDPATMQVTATFVGETDAKHAFALGETAVPPPTPALGQTPQERDELAAAATNPAGFETNLISTSYVTDADPLDGLLQATDTQITVETHTRTYSDREVTVTGGTLTEDDQGDPLVASTGGSTKYYHVYYDDPDRAGGAVVLKATDVSQDAATSATNPNRHSVGTIDMDVAGGSGTSGGGISPPGWDGNDYTQIP